MNNNDILAGNWRPFTGNILQHWDKLTNDDLAAAAGRRDQMVSKIQERYGLRKDEAERQIADFEARYEHL